MNTEIQPNITHAAKWAYMAESVNRLVRPIVTLIIASFLTPEDYGVVALTITITATASLLWSLGLPTALIQRKDDLDDAANVTFWLNGCLALLVFIVLVGGRDFWGRLFHEPRVAQALPIMSVPVLLDGLSMVQNALLQKRMAFSRLFWRSTLPSSIPLLVTLPLAISGYGFWSIAWGTAIGSLVGNVALWIGSGWLPHFHFNYRIAKEMVRFGIPTLGEAFQNWLENQADRGLLGLFFSTSYIGVYSLAVTVYSSIYGFVFSPIKSVGYASLCQFVDRPEEQKKRFLKWQQLIALVALPLGIGIVFVAPWIEKIVFGERYPGLAIMLRLLSIYYIASFSQGLFAALFRATGFPKTMLIVNLINACFIVVLYPLGAMKEIQAFLLFRGLISFSVLGLTMIFINKKLTVDLKAQLKPFLGPLAASFLMGLVLLAMARLLMESINLFTWFWLLFIVVSGLVIYLLAVRWMAPSAFALAWSYVVSTLRGKKAAI